MPRDIFNDYDDNGIRITTIGFRSSRIADNNILYNLRNRWPAQLFHVNDVRLINEYDEFSASDWFGNNDERFLEWIKKGE